MELRSTDENAIRFLVSLTTLLVCIGTGRALVGNGGILVGGVVGIFAILFSAIGFPEIYKMTMEDSLPILKMSLLIGLALSFVGAFSGQPVAPIAAIVFTISPILYDFVRDVAFPNVPKAVPWSERRAATKLLELTLEAAIGAVLSIMITLALTGHF